MTSKMVTIRIFPTKEGDTSIQVALDALTEEQVFKPGTMVAMSGVMYVDWDELLRDLQKTENAVIEQFKPIDGG
jgi:uncharacterized protein YqgV (UPF0045/DUF77 family)